MNVSERREYSRISLSLPVKVHLNSAPDQEVVYRSAIEDLSVSGFRIDLPNPKSLQVGQNLDFEIDTIRSPEPVRGKGRLCWIGSDDRSGWSSRAGVRLVAMEADDWDRWLHLMLTQSLTPPFNLA